MEAVGSDGTLEGAEPEHDTVMVGGSGQETAAEEELLPPGSMIGRYEVRDRLGAGGMGVVYAAWDPRLDREVALKLLKPEASGEDSSEGRARLLREAQAMARLAHPNVIAVYDVGTAGGHVFLAMELVDGDDLQEWVESGGRSAGVVLGAFMQAGRGLAAAHAAGLVHRDFKPSNVLVPQEDGRVRVLDFGLAHPLTGAAGSTHSGRGSDSGSLGDSGSSHVSHYSGLGSQELSNSDRLGARLTRAGVVMGTPAYMAPEQHAGRTTDARTDQFSFCVALYWALYGTRPFVGRKLETLRRAKLRGRIEPPLIQPALPVAVRRCIVRGLSADPEHRWSSMEALLDALHDHASGRRKRRWLAAAGGVAATLGLVGMAAASETTRCSSTDDRLRGIWDEAQKSEIQTAMEATDVSYVQDTWSRVQAQLDAYAQRWGELRGDACEMGRTDAQLADRRVACLEHRLDQFRAVTGVLAKADPQVVQRAVQISLSLDPLSECSDDEALASAFAPPDATTAGAVAELRRELERGKALEIAGKYQETLRLTQHVRDRSAELGYDPLRVEAMFLVGVALTQTGDFNGAQRTLVETGHLAESIGYDELAAMAASRLVFVVGRKQARFEDGLQWGRHAQALLQRLPDHKRVEASLLNSMGALLEKQGKSAEAEDHHRRALVLWKELDDEIDIAVTRNNLGIALYSLGRYEDAIEQYEAVLGIRRERLGAGHTDTGVALNNLGNALYELGRYDEALAQHQQALGIWKVALGADHPYVGASLNNLGNAAYGRGALEEAVGYYRQAVELRQRTVGPDHPNTASSMMNLGSALEGQGKSTEALVLFERALAILVDSVGLEHAWALSCKENIGAVLHGKKRFDEALTHQRDVLETRIRVLGEEHPGVVDARVSVGITLIDLGQPAQALPMLETALALRESGDHDPLNLADVRFAVARALDATGGDRARVHELVDAAAKTFESAQGQNEDALAELRAFEAGLR